MFNPSSSNLLADGTVLLGVVALLAAACYVVGSALLARTPSPTRSMLAPSVGFAVLMVTSAVAIRLPGDVTTALIVGGVLVLASVVVLARDRMRAFRTTAFADVGIVALLAFVFATFQYVASGRFGVPGVGVNDDTASHMYWILHLDRFGALPSDVTNSGYPTGPHALLGTLLHTFPAMPVELAFVGLLVVVQVLTAVTALVVLQDVPRWLRCVLASFVPFAYLAAAYSAQGAYKEPTTTLLVLSVAVALFHVPALGRMTWACVLFGAAALYLTVGPSGLFWPAGLIVVGVVLALVRRRMGPRKLSRRAIVAAVVTVAVAAVLGVLMRDTLALQLRTVLSLPTEGGNLTTYLPFLEVFGVWDSHDFRSAPPQVLHAGALAGLTCLLAAWSAWWWLRRGELGVPAAATMTLVLYAVSRQTQGPYWVAKLLAIASPLVLLIMLRATFADARRSAWRSAGDGSRLAAGILLVLLAGSSTAQVLAAAPVASLDRTDELAPIRRAIGDDDVLYLGFDYYMNVKLRGARVSHLLPYSIVNPTTVAASPTKPVAAGTLIDVDSVDHATLDRFDFLLTSSSSHSSELPENWTRVERTSSYQLYERDGATAARRSIDGGNEYGATYDCATAGALAPNEEAHVRDRPILFEPTGWTLESGDQPTLAETTVLLGPGQRITQSVELPAGTWSLSLQYQSPVRLQVEVDGTRVTLPPETDVMGQRWPIGSVTSTGGEIDMSIDVDERAIPYGAKGVLLGEVAAAPATRSTVRTGRAACGAYVDWIGER